MKIIHMVLESTGLTMPELYRKLIELGVSISRQGLHQAAARKGKFMKMDLLVGLIKVGKLPLKRVFEELELEHIGHSTVKRK